MGSSGSKLLSHGSIYLLGNILRRMVSFVMLPIYTQYLTPGDYGTLELLSMVIDVVAILFGLRIGEAIFRFYYKYDDARDRNEVIFTAFVLVAALNAIGVAFLLGASGPVSRFVFGSSDAARLLALFSFTLILQSLTETVLTFIRAEQRPWLFVGFSLFKLALQLGLNIYFVVGLELAVEGVIYSNLIAGLILAVPLAWYTVRRTGFAFSRSKAIAMTSFSAPLVLTSLVSFYMTFGDRYFLRVFGGGLDEVGVYALGYRFGFLLSFLIGEPFFSIWNSERYVIAKQPDPVPRFRTAFLLFSAAMAWATVAISLYVFDILRLMSDPGFWAAATIVPLVMLGYVFNNWASFANLGILLNDRTGEIATGTIISAVAITAGYFLLIPAFGGVGAAVATSIAFAGRTVWIAWRSEKLYPQRLPWSRGLAMLGAGALVLLLTAFKPEPIWLSVAYSTLLLGIYTGALFFMPGMLPPDLRASLIARLRARKLPSLTGA